MILIKVIFRSCSSYLRFIFVLSGAFFISLFVLKKNMNTCRTSEHPPLRGKNVKTFRWDHILMRPRQREDLRVSRRVI